MALIIRVYNEKRAQEISKTSRHMVHCFVRIDVSGEKLRSPFRWGWLTVDDAEPPIFVTSGGGVLLKGDAYSFWELRRIS